MVSNAQLAATLKSLSKSEELISKCLVDARLDAEPMAEFPVQLPETLEQAYAVQSASIERWPDQIGGWKVARLPMPDRDRFATERLVGPVFSSTIHELDAGSCATMPIYEGGFAAVEAEIVIVLGDAVSPSDRYYSDEELADMVAEVYCGAEIASSPLALVNDLGATSIISDFGCNAGVVVGPEITDWRTRPAESLSVSVTVDDELVGEAAPGAITGDPLQALRALIGLCARRGFELAKDAVVSTGMLTGVHEVSLDSIVRVNFDAIGDFELHFEPMQPQR